MNSNKAEAENREATQAKIAELEDRSAHLKDYTWLLKVCCRLHATLWLGPACRSPHTPVSTKPSSIQASTSGPSRCLVSLRSSRGRSALSAPAPSWHLTVLTWTEGSSLRMAPF